jgi:protein phosphatase 2C family protein 2/3
MKHFSNRPYEQQAVTSLPDVLELPRKKEDNFILLGCDGVWEKYVNSNQKMVDHLKGLQGRFNDKMSMMSKFFDDLVAKESKEGLGCDNMSGIYIEFL